MTDGYDVNRVIAANALYYVRETVRLVDEQRVRNTEKPLDETALAAILALRDKAYNVIKLVDPEPQDNLL